MDMLKNFFLSGDLLDQGPLTNVIFLIIYIPIFVMLILKKKSLIYHIIFIVFYIYIYNLFALLFLPAPISSLGIQFFRDRYHTDEPLFNIIPLKDITYFINRSLSMHDYMMLVKNVFGNIIALIPFGFLFPCINNNFAKFKKFVLISFFIPLGVEIIQLSGSLAIHAVWRFGDIDDIILNMVGMIIGFYILKLFMFVIEKWLSIDLFDLINKKSTNLKFSSLHLPKQG